MKNTTSTTPVKSSISNEIAPRRGFAEVHESMDINTFDISDYMVATITGTETPVNTVETDVTIEVEAPMSDELGHIAIQEVVAAPKLTKKSANKSKKTKESHKSLWEKIPSSAKFTTALGAAAVTAVTAFGPGLASADHTIERNAENRKIITTASVGGIENPVVTHENVDTHTTYFPIGGAGQGFTPPVGEMQHSGYINGMQIDPILYSANIGPVVGTESMIQSEQGGVNYGLPRVLNALDRGQSINIPAFSEGTGVQKELAWEIYDKYGYWPDQVTLTQIGGPYHPGGVFDSKFTKAANSPLPILDMMGIDRDSALPPGVKIEYVYYGDDPWAGNGNENFLTFLKNFAGIPVGNHAIPNENDPNAHIVVIQDKDGNLHKIFVRDQDVFITAIENAGLHVMDSASATAAINAFFPQNYDPNSTEAPRADVRAGMAFAAKALDAQFGTGDMIQKIVAGMPEELKQLMDDGWNGINDVMDAVATAMADPTPENLMHAFQVIGDTIQKVLGDVNATLESFGFNVSSPANMNVSAASMATQLKSSTGVDFSSSFQSLVNNFNQPAPQIQSAANTWLNAQAQLKLDQTQASANASLNVQTPITDIAASVNTNVTLPSATNGFNMNAQAEATVTTPAQESLNPAASVASGFFGTSETPVAPLAPAPSAAAAEISAPAPIVVTQESLSSGSVVANQFFETNDAPASVATPATTSSDTPSVNIFRPTTPAPAPVSAPEASAEISAPAAPVWEPVPAPEPVYVAPPAPVFIPEAVAPAPAPAPVVMPEPAPAPLLPIVEFAPAPAPVPAFEMPSAPAPAPAPFVMPDLSNILTPSSAPASTPTLPAFDFNLAPAPSGSSAEITLPGLG